MFRTELHAHSTFSNIRLIDSINEPTKLIDKALEMGLAGIALTDHECLSGHPKVIKYADKVHKEHPDFKVILGNEIYLVDERPNDDHYHFILLAKDREGHKQLRILSSLAWLNSYHVKGLERVDTLKADLERIVKENPGHLVAATACIGGELGKRILALTKAEKLGDVTAAQENHDGIVRFILWCKEVFGDDFYLECQPGVSPEQVLVNRRMVSIAQCFNVKMIVTCDAHYLTKEDRYVHKSYLNSKQGEREVDAFYQDAYLHTNEEIIEKLQKSDYDKMFVEQMFANTMEIYDKIENYSLFHKQTIPKVEVPYYHKTEWRSDQTKEFPTLASLYMSDDDIDRYWVNQCYDKLRELGKCNKQYLDRLEEEARVKKVISEKLETNIFAYPVTLQHYIDMFWESGTTVGAGRGSSCSGLNHYLLGVTQLDPIEWDFPFWRYLNDDRIELPDIDLDISPSKRPMIIDKIKQERGRKFKAEVEEIAKKNLGCTLVATFGTEGTKSAIQTACRGYRSEEFPNGIDSDTSLYLSSLVPTERGFLWDIDDVLYGNPEKGRKPSTLFIEEIEKYPGLLDIIKGIAGTINKRSSHASGVIFFDEDPFEFCCFMRTPKGEVITQYDLHDAEWCGLTKYDLLVTEVQDKIIETIKFLQEHNEIEPTLTLREAYDKYIHPSILPIDDLKVWDNIKKGKVLNLFQFETDVGSQGIKKIQPNSIHEMADANGLIRLVAGDNDELPLDKYVRYKNKLKLWYDEMRSFGLTEEEMKVVEPYFKNSYGVPPSQEQLMRMLIDENICGFSIAEANKARKIVGKKQLDKIPGLRAEILERAKSPCLGNYIWKCGVGPQMSYAFSIIHATAYSLIAFQTAYLSTRWNPIYWDTACLIVNSGSLEDNSTEELVSIYADEHQDMLEGTTFIDLPDRSGKIKKTSSTDYTKTAKALGNVIAQGIKISLVDINKSSFSFKPDIENNQILFGMKGVNKVNDGVVEQIIAGRPYSGIKDFMARCPLNKTIMVSLIKSGAFDNLDGYWAKELCDEPRIAIMAYYISQIYGAKKKLTLQNFNGLMEKKLVPNDLIHEQRTFAFNKYLKKNKRGEYYLLAPNSRDEEFYRDSYDAEGLEVINGVPCIKQTVWDKVYKKIMENARTWLVQNQQSVLDEYNGILFNEMWEKYAANNISAWEMEALCFYYHEHELINVDRGRYGISNYFELPEDPVVEYYFKRGGKDIPIFELTKIVGTVVGKNDTKSSISLLTIEGIVTVKFTKEYYAMFNRQISEVQEDGTKKIVEKGWFGRGTKLMITGFRRADMFVAKTYAATATHQIYLIEDIDEKGSLVLRHER